MARSTHDIEEEISRLLAGCRLITRGLWHEMRRLIEKESNRPGHLQLNGRPINDEQLALRAGCSSSKVAPLLQKLVEVGLIARADRCWHSPHLARIAALHDSGARRVREHRERRAQVGRADGTEQPHASRVLRNAGCNASVTPTPGPLASSSPTPSPPSLPSPPEAPGEYGSGATAGKRARRPNIPMPEVPDVLDTPEFRAAWSAWLHYRGQGRYRVTPQAAVIQLGHCARWGVERAIKSIENSISGSYRGLFEPPEPRGARPHAARSERARADERGQYAEPEHDVRTLTLDSAGATAGGGEAQRRPG